MLRLITQWKRCNLSILYKIQLLRWLCLYILQSINFPVWVLKEINIISFKYIWKKKFNNGWAHEKDWWNALCNNVENGGLNIILNTQASYLICWIQKLWQKKEAQMPLHCLSSHVSKMTIWKSNLNSEDFLGLNKASSSFWIKAIEACLGGNKIATTTQMCHLNIRNNTLIQNGITSLRQLFQTGQFRTYNEVRKKMATVVDFSVRL